MTSSSNIGTRRIVVGAHYGLRDWLAQRVTALIIAAYTVLLLLVLVLASDYSYDSWAQLFGRQWMKLATFVTFIAVAYHAWVGVRDIWMDYIKPVAVRLVLQVLSILWLIACAGYAAQILFVGR